MHIKIESEIRIPLSIHSISILSVLLDLQHQKFHGQIKVYISIQTSLGLIQSFDDFLDSLIAAALGHAADGTDLFTEYEMVHITGCLEQEHIPVPDGDEIQIIIDLQLIFRNLLIAAVISLRSIS